MSLKSFQLSFSRLSGWLTIFLFIWLLGAVGLGWLVNSFLILMGLLLLAPAIAFVWFRWWLQRNLVQSQCPVCSYELAALNRTQLQCPSCGELLKVEQGRLNRLTPPGTIDVQAVEVAASSEES